MGVSILLLIDGIFTGAGRTPKDIAFTPDGDLAYVTLVYDSDTVLAIDARLHAVLGEIPVWPSIEYSYTERGNLVAVSPDGLSAYVAVDHSSYERPSTVAVIDRDTQHRPCGTTGGSRSPARREASPCIRMGRESTLRSTLDTAAATIR